MPVSLNITLGNPEQSDALLSALNNALFRHRLTGHPPELAASETLTGHPPESAASENLTGHPPELAASETLTGHPPESAASETLTGHPPELAASETLTGHPPKLAASETLTGHPPEPAASENLTGHPPEPAASENLTGHPPESAASETLTGLPPKSAASENLTGHPPNPLLNPVPDCASGTVLNPTTSIAGFATPSLQNMWLFRAASLQFCWLFAAKPFPAALHMQASLWFLNRHLGKVDMSVECVASPKSPCTGQNVALQSTAATPQRQLTWQVDVARLADPTAELPLFLANARRLHCQFNPVNGLQICGWQPFDVPEAELANLNLYQALEALVGDPALLLQLNQPDIRESKPSPFKFEAALRTRLVQQPVSPLQSEPQPPTGGYYLVFDGSVRIFLNVSGMDAHQSADNKSAENSAAHKRAPTLQFSALAGSMLVADIPVSDVLPLHIPVDAKFDDLNTAFLQHLRSNLPALALQVVQALLQQPQMLARFLVLSNELGEMKTSAACVAAKLANQQVIASNVVEAVGLAEEALCLTADHSGLLSQFRIVRAVIDGRLGMINSVATPQIVRLTYLAHSIEKQTESAHLCVEWCVDFVAGGQGNELKHPISGYQLTIKDGRGNALLRQPRYLSCEMLNKTSNSNGEQVYVYPLPVNTDGWPAGVYFLELIPQARDAEATALSLNESAATVAIIKPRPPTCGAVLSSMQAPNNTGYAKNDLQLLFSWQPFPGVKRYVLQSPSENEDFALEGGDFAAHWAQGKWQPVRQNVVFSQSHIAGRYTFQLERVGDGSFIDTEPGPIQTWQRLAMVNEIELEIFLNPEGSKPTMSIWWDGNEGDSRFFPRVTMLNAKPEESSPVQSHPAVIEFVPKASVEASQVLVEMRPMDEVAQWRVAVRTVSNQFSMTSDAGQIPSQFTPEIVLYPPHIMAQHGNTSGLSIEECAQQIRDVFTDITLIQLTDVLSKAGYEVESANLFGLAQTDGLAMYSADDNPQPPNLSPGES